MLEIKAGDQVVGTASNESLCMRNCDEKIKSGNSYKVLESLKKPRILKLVDSDKGYVYTNMVLLVEDKKGTTESIVDMIRSRSEFGLNKYGVSMDRTDLTTEQWIQHAIEEMLDGAQYLYRIKQELAKRLDK